MTETGSRYEFLREIGEADRRWRKKYGDEVVNVSPEADDEYWAEVAEIRAKHGFT